jgi:hypothetical protein
MNLSDLKSSKFLKKEDVGAGVLWTITGITQANVAMEGAEPDLKAVVHFREFDKPLVLNSTNGQAIAKITGHEDDIENAWIGARVVLYNDPNVSFSGRIVGGIRVRAPRIKPAMPAAGAPPVPVAPVAPPPPPAQDWPVDGPVAGEEPLPF